MKLVGIMPVRNEDWILGFSLRVALKWCDQVIVCDHGCTDGSREIMNALGRDGVIVREDRENCWGEMEQRQMLLATARDCGATHIALIDADEVLTANLLPGIRGLVENTKPGWMLDLPLYNLRETCEIPTYHTNGVWGNRWAATTFADLPGLHWGGDTYHHREPFGQEWRGRRARPVSHGEGGTLHFWGASERRLRAKHALYRITERLRWPTKSASVIEYTYQPATNPGCELAQRMRVNGPWEFAAVEPEWVEPYADLMQYLHVDREPWQAAEVKRLVLEHGADKFHGLDLLGVENW